ncbi:hypothetical protein EB796_016508 [Bugula neritina]|uniref:Uncharacterized protein n=1 Tax=Bugula neritina TaxID=10212 RepID=A0A7J7JGQ0_BUGNE|nr:hypothetical protein EB796_016508 [Bugula neritina]
MFIAPPPLTQSSTHSASPPSISKSESRKPAKSRVKKFWNKGKTNSKLNADNKPLSLSQPNLAALDRDAEVKPITMYEMSIGHSLEGKGR